jgi:hypothetical protein
MRAESHLRLMERPGDDARRWNLNLNDAVAGLIEISIFDEIEVRGEGVPVHVGVRVVVDRHSSDLDAAVAEAEHHAAVALALLSASARAPTDSRTLDLAYEITPDADVRQIRQWFWNTPIVVGKTPVPEALFGDLFTSFTECTDEKLLWRITQSISWHQRALAEADAVARFTGLWIACEALEPRLRELFEIRDEKSSASLRLQFKPLRLRVERPPLRVVFPGLKALADADGATSDLVRRGYTLRNDLFHARRVAAPDLVARARDLIPGLEGLLPSAWSRLLGISERTIDFPAVSVVPHRVGMFFDAELLHQDEKQWDKIWTAPRSRVDG